MKRIVLFVIFSAPVFAQASPAIPGMEPVGGRGRGAPAVVPATPAPQAPGRGRGATVPAGRGTPVPGRGAPVPSAAASGRGAAAPAWPRDLKYPPLHSVMPPKPLTATLPNGMKLYLVEEHELPVLHGIVMIRTGYAFDPPDRIGLATLAGMLVRGGGSALLTGDQVDETLQSLGMTMESSIGETSGTVTFTALRDNADASLTMLKEVLTQPEFRQDRLELVKGQVRNAISHKNDDLAKVAQRELTSLIFGKDSPYGWGPDYSTIERITRLDLKNFHKRYFFPANMMLGISGDFAAGQMKTTIEKLFADWNPAQPPVPAFPKVKATPAPGIYLAEKKDAPQTYLSAGHLGGIANQKDFPALEVAGLIFNALQERITQRARAQLGTSNVRLMGVMVGDVNAIWGTGFDHEGVFRISASTRGASTIDAVKAISDEIERMRTVEVSDEELRAAKDSALAALTGAWDTPTKAFAQLLHQEYYGYPADFVQRYQAGIAAVTKADVLRVAKQYMSLDNLTTVVVGNPVVFSEPLEKLSSQINKIDLTIPDAKAQVAETTDVSLAEGKRLLARAQAAAGGADKLAAVKDYLIVADYVIDPNVKSFGGSKIVQTDRWIGPTTFRQDLVLPTGRVSAYSDGKAGWIFTPQGQGALVGVQLKQVQGDLFRSYIRMLLSDRIEGRTANAVDQDQIELSDTTGQIARLEFDPKTGLPRRATYEVPQAVGAPIFTEDIFDDFRDVAGVKVPFKIAITQAGRKFADVVVTDYKINSGLKPTDLARRQQ